MTVETTIPQSITDIHNPNRSTKLEDYLPTGHIGRPLKYDPLFHPAKTIEFLMEGKSLCGICKEFRINEDTIYDWRKKYPEFSEAIKRGITFSKGWWEDKGQCNIDNTKFNSTLWYMNMKNRFGWNDPKPTYAKQPIEGYEGSLLDKASALNKKFMKGEMSADEHKDAMVSLANEAKVLEIFELKTNVDKLMQATGLDKNK